MMRQPQIIRSASGDELIVLSRAEYEDLITRADAAAEGADEAAVYDARKSELATGSDARLPPEVSAAVLKGHSLLRAIRLWRGLSQLHISERAGLGQGYLSDLENGRRAGATETLEKLAQVLDVPVLWLRPTEKV